MSTIDYTYMKSVLTNNGIKIGKYVLTKKIGSGNFSNVWIALDTQTNKIYACKQITKKSIDTSVQMKKLLQNEVGVMHKINHPNIIHLHEQYVSENHYYLIMDYCNQGDLEKYMSENNIKYFEEKDGVRLLRQIMNGFTELRTHKILHRDLKLANIYMHNDRLIIGDFGFAKMGSEYGRSILGTPMTMAPEILFHESGTTIYNSKADLWSVGVVFYQLLFGRWPFFGKNENQLKQNIQAYSGDKLPFPGNVSNESRDLLQRLLTFNPKSRIEWKDFFRHPVFKKFPEVPKNKHVLEEFIKNAKSQKFEPEVVFYNEEEFTKLDLPDISEKIQEEPFTDSFETKLVNLSLAKEVFFRYSHELNKVFFFIYTVRKISEMLKNKKVGILDQQIMNISILVLLKAMTVNKIISETLKREENIYRLNEESFAFFVKSDFAGKILGIAAENNLAMRKHFGLLDQRAVKNRLPFAYMYLVTSGKITLAEIEQVLRPEIAELAKFKVEEVADLKEIQEYHLLRVLAHYSLHSADLFKYCNFHSKYPKFNWGGLYYTIEKSSSSELKALY